MSIAIYFALVVASFLAAYYDRRKIKLFLVLTAPIWLTVIAIASASIACGIACLALGMQLGKGWE